MIRKLLVFIAGLAFGWGLALSTMVRQEVVLSFLTLDDLGLALVMLAGVAVIALCTIIAHHVIKKPPIGGKYMEMSRWHPTKNTAYGAAIFGVGWGISGICPGSAFASLGVLNWPILYGIAGLLLGAYLHGLQKGDAQE